MKKVMVNGRERRIIGIVFSNSQNGWASVKFFNYQEGFYNTKTGEVIDQIEGKYIVDTDSINNDGLVDVRLEDGSRCIFECDRKLYFPYKAGSSHANSWEWLIYLNPENFQYLPSKEFYEGRHIDRTRPTASTIHFYSSVPRKRVAQGYIDLAFDSLEEEKEKLSVDEFKERCERLKAIIAKRLEEEKDTIEAGKKAREEEARVKAENERLEEEKTNILADARKAFTSSQDDSEDGK